MADPFNMRFSEALVPHRQGEHMFGTGGFFQRGNYAPVSDELSEFDLEVEGTIPPELDGWYLRNGPNPRQHTAHWFTGEGMIHGVRVEKGRAAWYRNRWVRTESFEKAIPLYNGDGTRNLHSSLANTNVISHAGKTLALVELSLPYEITNDLETVGVHDFNGELANSMTAHPKICPTTGELHFFGYGNIAQPHVSYHRADADGNLTVSRPLAVKELTMMHDMALSAKHVVFMDLPIVWNAELARSNTSDIPYRWSDEYGARLGILRRDDPYGNVLWIELDPCYVYHTVNAYDDGDKLVVETVRYPEMWRGDAGFGDDGVMWRWSVDLKTGQVSNTQIDDRVVEFPTVDPRIVGLPARYAVAAGHDYLVRYDLQSGGSEEHIVGGTKDAPNRATETVFIPSADGGDDEGHGWYMGFVYDAGRNTSDLVIIDSTDFSGPPVARIKLPVRVPFGFHGNWIPADA